MPDGTRRRRGPKTEGARIDVTVRPRARVNKIRVAEDGTLKVFVTAVPEAGKANEAVVALLADRLRLPKRSVSILRGHSNTRKVLLVEGLAAGQVLERLSARPGAERPG